MDLRVPVTRIAEIVAERRSVNCRLGPPLRALLQEQPYVLDESPIALRLDVPKMKSPRRLSASATTGNCAVTLREAAPWSFSDAEKTWARRDGIIFDFYPPHGGPIFASSIGVIRNSTETVLRTAARAGAT